MKRFAGRKSFRKKKLSRTRHIAFSVSAGCYPYQMGIASYIQKNFELEDVFFSGASGGAWAALLLAAEEDLDEALAILISDAPKCCVGRNILGAYGVYDVGMKLVFNRLFEDRDLSAEVNGRLAISVTRMAWKSFSVACESLGMPYLKDEVISHFTSNSDIIDCIIASALIPFALNGRPYVRYRDWACCVDAGMTNVPGVVREYDRMSSLIHKPADLKSLNVRASPRSSRCPTVVWDENENQVENVPTEEDAAEGKVVENDWKAGAVKGLGDISSIQDGRCDDGASDGVCVGWLGGIDTEEGQGQGKEIFLESDGYGGEGGEGYEESKEECRITGGERSIPTQLNAAAAAVRRLDHSDRYKSKDLTTEIEVERGRGQVAQEQWSGTGIGTASVSREVKHGFATRASGVDGGVSGKGSAPKLTVIHQWLSLPDIWVMDSGFEESPSTNNEFNCRKIGTESNLNSVGNFSSLNPVDHSGPEEGGDNRDIVRTIVTDDGLCNNSNKGGKAREMVNTAETAEQNGQNNVTGTKGGTEGAMEGEVPVGGIVTAPWGESRGRASTVFLSLWDIAAYGTGALGARLEDIERYGLRSRGYLDDESDTEEEDSDIDRTSWADTDESGAGMDMLDIFNSTLFSGGYTAIVRAADIIKTSAQTAFSFPGRISIPSLPSLYSRPAGRKASLPPTPGTSSTPYLSRGEGVGTTDMTADQLREKRQQTHYESSASFSASIPTNSLDGTMDRRNQTKVIVHTTDINVSTDKDTDLGSCTFLSRLMAVKKDFFQKKPYQYDSRDARTPGLFPLLGAGRDADYTVDEGGSVRGSAHTDWSALNDTAHESHLHPAQLLTVDLDSTGINGKHPANTLSSGMTQLYPSLSHTQHFSSSTLDIDQSRSRSTTFYARSEAENESIFSSDSFLPPATLPYGLLSLGLRTTKAVISQTVNTVSDDIGYVLNRTARVAVGASKDLLRPMISLPRSLCVALAAMLSTACRVILAYVPFSFHSSSTSSASSASSSLAPSFPVTTSAFGGKDGLKSDISSNTSKSKNERKHEGAFGEKEMTMKIETSKVKDTQHWTSDAHTDRGDKCEGGNTGYTGSRGYGSRISDFFAPPPFPQDQSTAATASAPSTNTTAFRPKEGVWQSLRLFPPGQCTSFSTSVTPLHPSETPSPSTVEISHSDSSPFPFLLSASSFSTFSSSEAHPSTASFACLTPNSCAPSLILPLRSKIPHSMRSSLLPFGPSPTYFLASDVPTVTARPVPPHTSRRFPNALHMTEANLTPVKSNGHSNLMEGPETLDSDCDSDGEILDYSDSDTESETEGERRREKDRETERETEGERDSEGDQGYLTASDGEEGDGDDEQKWTNGSRVSEKLAGSDRKCTEHPSTLQGLSRSGPKRDGANDQSPQRARTVRTVVMKRKIRSASVTGRSVKDSEEDRERDRERDRPFFHIPQTPPSSSGPHTHAHVPQSPGYAEESHPTVDVRGDVSTDMRSVHSVRTPLRTSRHSRGSGVGVSVGVGSDMRGERGDRGKSAENDDVRVRREGRVKKDTEKEHGMDTPKIGIIFERESEEDRERCGERGRAGDLPEGDWKGKSVHKAEGRNTDGQKQTDGSSSDAPQGKGSMWHTTGQRHSVKTIPTGGRLLEIAPWTWRSHPVLHFSLTSDPAQIAMLFALGDRLFSAISTCLPYSSSFFLLLFFLFTA